MTPREKWKWFGTPGRFIASSHCRFHMCTLVGKYLVSTVGEWVPGESTQEIIARSRGVKLEGQGDYREADFLRKLGHQEIGCERKYETMVFKAGAMCKLPGCKCGLPEIDGSELDFGGYNERGDATEGHMKLCAKWARK